MGKGFLEIEGLARAIKGLPGVVDHHLPRVFSHHLDIAPKRDGRYQVLGLPLFEPEEPTSESQGELEHPNPRPFCNQEVAQLVDEDEQPQHDHKWDNGIEKNVHSHEACPPFLR